MTDNVTSNNRNHERDIYWGSLFDIKSIYVKALRDGTIDS